MNKQQEDIKLIREMMERSTKFLSLSGLSGVAVGIVAIIGAAFAYYYLNCYSQSHKPTFSTPIVLLADALVVLGLSMALGFFFSYKKAKQSKQKISSSLTKRILYNISVPLITGGIFSLILLFRDQVGLAAASTLIFYGITLYGASRFTIDEIRYLGLTEIVLGLLAALFINNGLLFWTLGFGFCHILYGIIMYVKYDTKKP